MALQIAKWGNSLALRIPKDVAEQAGLAVGSVVKANVRAGILSVTHVRAPKKRSGKQLSRLLKGMTPAHFQHEITWGTPVGKEVW
jgi:antitoxin MazE